jgi:hypothetical protein
MFSYLFKAYSTQTFEKYFFIPFSMTSFFKGEVFYANEEKVYYLFACNLCVVEDF